MRLESEPDEPAESDVSDAYLMPRTARHSRRTLGLSQKLCQAISPQVMSRLISVGDSSLLHCRREWDASSANSLAVILSVQNDPTSL